MRIAVFGSGGVGGYFGAKLALGGHDVTFIARGKHLAAMRASGLRIESPSTPMILPTVRATDRPEDVHDADVVMFCVKLWDVEAAAKQLAPMLAPDGVAIPFQNGVEAPGLVARAVGDSRTLGGVAYIAATISAPGVITQTGTMAQLRVGAFPNGPATTSREFATVCKAAAIECEDSDDIALGVWRKFIFLAPMSGCTAAARVPIGGIRNDADLRATFIAAVREAVALGRSRGIGFAANIVDEQIGFLDRLPAEMRSSMLNDLVAGNRLEAPWLSGAIARMSAEAGLPAPVNATLYAVVKPYCDGARTAANG